MKTRPSNLFAGLALAFVASTATAETITGRVVNSRGEPPERVEWKVSGHEERDGGVVLFSGSAYRGITDEDGRFAIETNSQYRYDIQFDHFAYAPTFVFRVDHDTTDLRVTLGEDRVVKGRVVRTDRSPEDVSNRVDAIVRLMLPNSRGTWYHEELRTDASGNFECRIDSPPSLPDGTKRQRQLRFVGEIVELNESDLAGKAEIVFEVQVRARRSPLGDEPR